MAFLASVTGCSADDPVRRQALPTATVVPTEHAVVPDGWTARQGAGFTVAIPPGWQTRPADQRGAADAALEVGVPFTGQPAPPPRLIVFVEQENVGPLSVREPLLRAQIADALPQATLGASRHVPVAGAVDAVQFDVSYTTKAATSVLGTPLEPTPMQQRELIVETPGLPKFGVRYSAPSAQFSEDVWRGIEQSLTVGLTGDAPGTPSGTGA